MVTGIKTRRVLRGDGLMGTYNYKPVPEGHNFQEGMLKAWITPRYRCPNCKTERDSLARYGSADLATRLKEFDSQQACSANPRAVTTLVRKLIRRPAKCRMQLFELIIDTWGGFPYRYWTYGDNASASIDDIDRALGEQDESSPA